MGVDCYGRCSLGVEFFSLLPHMVDLKVPMGVAVVHDLMKSQWSFTWSFMTLNILMWRRERIRAS
jgi:hypothetical protein